MCCPEIDKIKASVVVIGFQREDIRLYPHLRDVLEHLRDIYDDVIYVADDDYGRSLYFIDQIIEDFCHIKKFTKIPRHVFRLMRWRYKYMIGQKKSLIRSFKNIRLKYNKMFILAIDHYASVLAEKYFPGRVVFWSCSIMTKNYPLRIKGGFLEKLIISDYARRIKSLIIQDEDRKSLVEEVLGMSFQNIIYLPISLNDSDFCREEAKKRQKRDSFPEVSIIQIGWIDERRWSCDLIESYQKWPDTYRLNLHGFLERQVRKKLRDVKRKPCVSETVYDNIGLPHMLNKYDIGFVSYKNSDANFRYIKNASGQLVEFLRLGIPVISCGPDMLKDFISKANIGVGISSMEDIEKASREITCNYQFFSHNAREVFEKEFNLDNIFGNYLHSPMHRLFERLISEQESL